MAPHSSTLAWKIPWTEGPGRRQSMGSLGVRLDWATSLSLFTFMHWRRKWQPTPVFLPGESQGRGAWWAAVYGVTQSRTQLKWLSSSNILHQWDNADVQENRYISQSWWSRKLKRRKTGKGFCLRCLQYGSPSGDPILLWGNRPK